MQEAKQLLEQQRDKVKAAMDQLPGTIRFDETVSVREGKLAVMGVEGLNLFKIRALLGKDQWYKILNEFEGMILLSLDDKIDELEEAIKELPKPEND